MTTLEWDTAHLEVANVAEASRFVRRRFRDGWETRGF
jgi:hypothetical protein